MMEMPAENDIENMNRQYPPGPRCSVVIPWHRNITDLDRAVESVMAQDRADFEIVVVVNGVPREDVRDIAGRYAGLPVRTLYSGVPNACVARNTGFHSARGELVFFLDADDTFLPTKLSTFLEEYAREPFDLAFSRGLRARGDGVSWPFPIARWDGAQHISEFFFCDGHMISSSALVLAKERCRNLSFDETLRFHQDTGLILAAATQALRMRMLPDILYEWNDRSSENRLSQVASFEDRLTSAEKLRALMTDRAVHAFRVRCIAQHAFPDRFWQCLTIFRRAIAARAVPRKDVALFVLRGLIPGRLRRSMINAYFRRKSATARQTS